MKKTAVPILDSSTCEEAYSNWLPCEILNICPVSSDICTGGDNIGRNSCAGDTGGPLVDMDQKVI